MKQSGQVRVTVEVADRGRRLGRFLAVPHRVYARDPAWIAPLEFEQRRRLSPNSRFLQNARMRAWVACVEGEPVGRITAQVDELHQRQHGDELGYFGMIEAIDRAEVYDALFRTAEEWLRGEGMRRVRGPYNLHVNEELGLLVEGFSTPPFVLMGHGRPYYAERLLEQGYRGVKDLLAYRVRPDFEAPRAMTRLAERAPKGVSVRCFRRGALLREAEVMRDIFNDAWENNWSFVPLEREAWLDTVKTLTAVTPDDYIQIAEYDGRPAAFIVALPNLNEAARDLRGRVLPFGWLKLLWRLKLRHPETARVPLMGVLREYQHSRLGPTLAFMVIDAVRRALHRRGVRNVEMGWILEDNDGMRNIIETIGGEAYKRYRMYEKDL